MDKNTLLNILIVGTGMYVSGRGSEGYGTILPAVYEWWRKGPQGNLYIAGARSEGIDKIKEKVRVLNELYGFTITPKYFPEDDVNNPEAYLGLCDDMMQCQAYFLKTGRYSAVNKKATVYENIYNSKSRMKAYMVGLPNFQVINN